MNNKLQSDQTYESKDNIGNESEIIKNNGLESLENLFIVSGLIVKIEPIRYTPIGLPVISFEVEHRSKQMQSNNYRDAILNFSVLAVGDVCKSLIGKLTNTKVRIKGFIANKSLKSKKPILNALEIEFIDFADYIN